MQSITSWFQGSNNTPSEEERIFQSATEQLPPEETGFSTSSPHQYQTFKLPSQSSSQVTPQPLQLARQQKDIEDKNKGLVADRTRTHFDTLIEQKDMSYNPLAGTPRLVQDSDVRSNLDLKLYFDRVITFFQKEFPNTTIPNLHFNIVPRPGNPFLCQTERSECQISPLALAQNGPMARKIFRILAPSFQESQRKLLEVTDSLYYSPERVQFNLAKALCEAAAGAHTPFTLLKLQFLRFSPQKYAEALAKKEMESDALAARLSADIALGGLEHVTKLHHYRLVYESDLLKEDPAWVSDQRFLNMLEVVKENYNIGPAEAVKLALNPRAFISDDPSKVYAAAEHIIQAETARQQKAADKLELQAQLHQGKV